MQMKAELGESAAVKFLEIGGKDAWNVYIAKPDMIKSVVESSSPELAGFSAIALGDRFAVNHEIYGKMVLDMHTELGASAASDYVKIGGIGAFDAYQANPEAVRELALKAPMELVASTAKFAGRELVYDTEYSSILPQIAKDLQGSAVSFVSFGERTAINAYKFNPVEVSAMVKSVGSEAFAKLLSESGLSLVDHATTATLADMSSEMGQPKAQAFILEGGFDSFTAFKTNLAGTRDIVYSLGAKDAGQLVREMYSYDPGMDSAASEKRLSLLGSFFRSAGNENAKILFKELGAEDCVRFADLKSAGLENVSAFLGEFNADGLLKLKQSMGMEATLEAFETNPKILVYAKILGMDSFARTYNNPRAYSAEYAGDKFSVSLESQLQDSIRSLGDFGIENTSGNVNAMAELRIAIGEKYGPSYVEAGLKELMTGMGEENFRNALIKDPLNIVSAIRVGGVNRPAIDYLSRTSTVNAQLENLVQSRMTELFKEASLQEGSHALDILAVTYKIDPVLVKEAHTASKTDSSLISSLQETIHALAKAEMPVTEENASVVPEAPVSLQDEHADDGEDPQRDQCPAA